MTAGTSFTPVGLRTAVDAAAGGSRLGRPADLVAAAIHSCFVLAGFRLVGTAEDAPALHPPVHVGEALPAGWNAHSGFAFRYRHDQSALTFVVKATLMGHTLMVHGMSVEDNRVTSCEVNINDLSLGESLYPAPSGDRPPSSLFRTDNDQLIAFMDKIKKIIIELTPALSKPGFEHLTSTRETQTSTQAEPSRRPHPFPGPSGPAIPPPFHPGLAGPTHGRSPFSIGHEDLDPLGGRPPLGPTPFGGWPGGVRPDFGGGFPQPGGGSILGPDHPMFTGPPPDDPGVWGGDAYLPRGAVPPGARFDPIVPQVPPGGGPGGVSLGRGRGRGRGNIVSGEPEPDEFLPPGQFGPHYDQNMFM